MSVEWAACKPFLSSHTSDLNKINPAILGCQEKGLMFGNIKALSDHPFHFLLPPSLFCVCSTVEEGSKGISIRSNSQNHNMKPWCGGECSLSRNCHRRMGKKHKQRWRNLGKFYHVSNVSWKQTVFPFPLSHVPKPDIIFFFMLSSKTLLFFLPCSFLDLLFSYFSKFCLRKHFPGNASYPFTGYFSLPFTSFNSICFKYWSF